MIVEFKLIDGYAYLTCKYIRHLCRYSLFVREHLHNLQILGLPPQFDLSELCVSTGLLYSLIGINHVPQSVDIFHFVETCNFLMIDECYVKHLLYHFYRWDLLRADPKWIITLYFLIKKETMFPTLWRTLCTILRISLDMEEINSFSSYGKFKTHLKAVRYSALRSELGSGVRSDRVIKLKYCSCTGCWLRRQWNRRQVLRAEVGDLSDPRYRGFYLLSLCPTQGRTLYFRGSIQDLA